MLLVLLLLAAFWSRQTAFSDAEAEVRDGARSLVAHVLRIMEVGDLLLLHQQDVATHVERRDPATRATLNARLLRMVGTAPYVFRLFMVDENGDVYATSMRQGQPLNARDRAYFQLHEAGEQGLHMSSILRSQATGEPIVILSRRVNGPNGEFRGVVLVSFQLDTLRDFARGLMPEGRQVVFQIINSGMQVIVDGAPGPDLTGIEIAPEAQEKFKSADEGVWTYTGLEEKPRIWAHQRVGPYPVYVRVGVATSDVIRSWERSLLPYGALALLVLAVLGVLSAVAVRYATAVEHARRDLDLANRDLERRVQERTAALEVTNNALRSSEARLQLILDAARLGTYERDLVYNTGLMSTRGLELHGLEAEQKSYTAESFIGVVHPDDRGAVREAMNRALTRQEPYDVEYRVILPDRQVRWIGARGEVFFGEDNQARRVAGISYDITERKRAEQRLRLLAREVDHRARNLLAVVQAMVRMTRAGTIEEFIDSVEGRISALGRAHTLLAESRWSGAELRRMIDRELAAYKAGAETRVEVTGPTVMLNPAAAQSLAMAVHELATNALKYGALSVPSGRVRLDWSWTADGRLALRWTESGGPLVHPPSQFGFGTRVISGTIKRQLRGDVRIDWKPDGLRCEFILPGPAITEMPPDEMDRVESA